MENDRLLYRFMVFEKEEEGEESDNPDEEMDEVGFPTGK